MSQNLRNSQKELLKQKSGYKEGLQQVYLVQDHTQKR